MPSARPHYLLFLKSPRAGTVKTRLAHDLGDQAACQVYRAIVAHTLSQIPHRDQIRIYFSPADAAQEMRSWLGPSLSYHPQVDGDLGTRIRKACTESFAAGASSVILLGGDCADLTTAHLAQAAALLAQKKPVIGPARDGGYWLLGITENHPGIFENIPWSSETVLQETLDSFSTLTLKPHKLDLLEDIDDLPALMRATKAHPFLTKFIQTSP